MIARERGLGGRTSGVLTTAAETGYSQKVHPLCASAAGREAAERQPQLFLDRFLIRTSVYIDGFNLYYRALRRTSYCWLDIGKLVAPKV